MESALVSIFIEAFEKFAVLTGSKLFIIFESPSGANRLGGDEEMMEAFQNGLLAPKVSDPTTENQEESYEISTDVEKPLTSIGLGNFGNAGNTGYELRRGVDGYDNAMVRKRTRNLSDHDTFSEMAENIIFPPQEYTDVKPALISDGDEDGDLNAAPIYQLNDKVYSTRTCSENGSSETKDPTWNLGEPGFYSTDNTSGMKKCGLCPPEIAKTYKYKGYLSHRLTKHDRKHVCTECNRTFQCPARLKKHKLHCQRFFQKWSHKTAKHDRKHVCLKCNRAFACPAHLKKHKLSQRFCQAKAKLSKKAKNPTLPLQQCTEKKLVHFPVKNLDGEQDSNHNAERVNQLNKNAIATKTFSDSSSKTQDDTWNPLHLTDTISGMKKCGLCPPDIAKTYKYKGYLCHRITKHDRKHACNECNRTFQCPARLQKHKLDCPRTFQT